MNPSVSSQETTRIVRENLDEDMKRVRLEIGITSLLLDADSLTFNRYRRSGLCEGFPRLDLAERNIIVRGYKDRIPVFTIIDQYHLGAEETHHHRKTYG